MVSQQIVLSRLEDHLCVSSNIVGDIVDAADLKSYIFPLLFFKQVCDCDNSGDAE